MECDWEALELARFPGQSGFRVRLSGTLRDVIDQTQKLTGREIERAYVDKGFLGALDHEDPDADRKVPKAISPVVPCSAWTAKANKRVQFGYGLHT